MSTSASPTDAMHAAQRRATALKRDRVVAAAKAVAGGTVEPTVTSVCRAARVSTSFVYRHLDLRAEVEAILATAVTDPGPDLRSARVTVRSLQTDLENQRGQNQRLRHQVSKLERRLSELVGVATFSADLSAWPDAQPLKRRLRR